MDEKQTMEYPNELNIRGKIYRLMPFLQFEDDSWLMCLTKQEEEADFAD